MKNIDFLIIGAQKCATTTLHQYFTEHPQILLPEDKEAPFFNTPDVAESSYRAYLQQHFSARDSDGEKRWGKASPQYMSSPLIPSRIKTLAPDVKLIAVLKDPIKRAFSHYRMAVRRGTDNNSFERAAVVASSPEALARGRHSFAPTHANGYESESDYYVAWGEYGRILEPYAAEFGDRLLVLFTNDIQADPAATLDRLLAFLGLETGWRPESLGKTFHKGGGKPWISPQAIKNLAHTPPLSHIYGWVSEAQKRRLRFWIDQLNVRKNDEKMVLSPETSLALRTLYREDAQRLAKIGIEPPWLNDWRNAEVPSTRQ